LHVVLGILTSLVTILYLLDRMGIDLGGLNPFYWRRRRAWARKYHGDPIYSVEDPVQLAAILIVGAARLDGDLTAEEKRAALALFRSRFHLGERDAAQLMNSVTHLLGARQVLDAQLNGLVEKNSGRFTAEQAESIVDMIIDVVSAGGGASGEQREFVEMLRNSLVPSAPPQGTWA